MSRKAWLITQENGTEIETVDVIPARRKIAYVDQYLMEYYAQIFGGEILSLNESITHPSGREAVLQKDGNILRAVLGDVDMQTYDRFNPSEDDDSDW